MLQMEGHTQTHTHGKCKNSISSTNTVCRGINTKHSGWIERQTDGNVYRWACDGYFNVKNWPLSLIFGYYVHKYLTD